MQKTNIKLSKNAQKITANMVKINELLNEINKLGGKIETDERHLVGSIICGTYSPIAKIARVVTFGPTVAVDGLRDQLVEEGDNEPSLATMMARLRA